jgi:hypothetical protein
MKSSLSKKKTKQQPKKKRAPRSDAIASVSFPSFNYRHIKYVKYASLNSGPKSRGRHRDVSAALAVWGADIFFGVYKSVRRMCTPNPLTCPIVWGGGSKIVVHFGVAT